MGSIRKKRVLILDDEEMIRELTRDIFQLMGFEVETAGTGEEALAIFERAVSEKRRFDMVIFDLTLPGEMDGVDTLEAVRKIDPEVKAIVSSGYSEDNIMSAYRDFGFDAAVPKPYTITSLQEAIASILD
jgi:CheY-like chemotaxis protein